ncbi:hypothetical protein ACHAPE_002875 [Trichoderma viride]
MAPPRGLGQLMGILGLLLVALVPHLVAADCECGFVAHSPLTQKQAQDYPGPDQLFFTSMQESRFYDVQNISRYSTWKRQQYNVSARAGRGEYGKTFATQNVYSVPQTGAVKAGYADSTNGGIALVVGSAITNNSVPTAELDSARNDMAFGTYRAGIKLTPVNGTCAAFFWYFNDTQEIDMEFLSRQFDVAKQVFPVNLVIQSEAAMQAGYNAAKTGTFKVVNLAFDPTLDFHEYRFDFLQDRVRFYADSRLLAEMNGSSIPTSPGHLILQHWSNGNPLWSAGPPEEDAAMTVSYVKAYFNSSDANVQSSFNSDCQKALSKGSNDTVCEIPNVTAVNSSTGGTFFNTSDPNDTEKNGAVRLGSTWATTASALLLVLVLTCL